MVLELRRVEKYNTTGIEVISGDCFHTLYHLLSKSLCVPIVVDSL